ncbi:hypothetical protein P9112_002571 [Eukaryota sp. TZLM1-RC]
MFLKQSTRYLFAGFTQDLKHVSCIYFVTMPQFHQQPPRFGIDTNQRPTHYTRPKPGRHRKLERNTRKLAKIYRQYEIDAVQNVHLDDFHRQVNWESRPSAKLVVHEPEGDFVMKDGRAGNKSYPTSD